MTNGGRVAVREIRAPNIDLRSGASEVMATCTREEAGGGRVGARGTWTVLTAHGDQQSNPEELREEKNATTCSDDSWSIKTMDGL